jgi:2-dehydro-3-deoxyphosphogluconate aldolase/(4S)-4-hydroxy-2-oxoglutarate aldolase
MNPMFSPSLASKIEKIGIVAVLVVDEIKDAVPLARALLSGGVNAIELTLRTPVALDALKAIKADVPEMLLGVGTILTTEQVAQAVEAGAAFGVAPGLNPRVLAAARGAGLSFAPGILTPSDIETALEYGCQLLKFFPAESSGGLPYLKAISAPYSHLGLRFMPLGGLNAKNMTSYLADPSIAALGGSWLAPRELIKAGQWENITTLAAESVRIIQSIRQQ